MTGVQAVSRWQDLGGIALAICVGIGAAALGLGAVDGDGAHALGVGSVGRKVVAGVVVAPGVHVEAGDFEVVPVDVEGCEGTAGCVS